MLSSVPVLHIALFRRQCCPGIENFLLSVSYCQAYPPQPVVDTQSTKLQETAVWIDGIETLMGFGGADGPCGVTPGGAGGGGGGTQYVKLLGCVALRPIRRCT